MLFHFERSSLAVLISMLPILDGVAVQSVYLGTGFAIGQISTFMNEIPKTYRVLL